MTDPFLVRLTVEQQRALSVWICDQITLGLNARTATEIDVEYWWRLYEQARTRQGRNVRPDAADLTSYIPCEQTDSIHARIMRTIWTEPIWTVEGWGQAAEKAPFVEEFHQWKAEEERLQGVLDRLVLQALVEPRGLLEIAEGTERRAQRQTVRAVVQTDPLTGLQQYDEKGKPILKLDDQGEVVTATDDKQPSVEQTIDRMQRVRTGPVYRLLPYRDSLILPGHARDSSEIWGYGKRFARRWDELKAKASGKTPIYDKDAVDKLRTSSDRETNPSLQRSGMDVAPQDKGQAEIELWELLVLVDFEQLFENLGQGSVPKALRGERWYLITVHPGTQGLLRVQHDDLERSRFVSVILNPRADRATEGYSLIGHKLITITEEHTAWRNLTADKEAMTLNAPIKRQQGALWDPDEQPMGAGAVIDVRDMNELQPMVIPANTEGGFRHIDMMERTAQRIGGVNDVASGQTVSGDKTLGEIRMATEQSFVRMDLIVRRFQEAMEDIAQIRHAIWKRTLADMPEGTEVPPSVIQQLEGRGVSIDQYLPDQKVTAQLLEGSFRFKPHGSVENADRNASRQNTVALLDVIPKAIMAFPMLQMMFQTPQAARAIGRMIARDFGGGNSQALIGSPAQDLEMTAKAQVMTFIANQMQLQQTPMMGGPMGGPPMGPGAPPPPGMAPGAPPAGMPPGPPAA